MKGVAALQKRALTPLRVVIAVCVLAFIVRVAFILTLEEKWYFYDTKHYDAAARSLLRGEGFTLDYEFFNSTAYNLEPAYPLFLAAHYAFGRVFLAVRLSQALLGVLLCVLVYRIGAKMFGAWQGVIAAALCAVYPHLIFISGLLYPEQLFTTLLAAGVLFMIHYAGSRRLREVIWGGCVLAVATLTKGILLAFIPLAGIWIFGASGRVPLRRRLARPVVFYAVSILMLLPWTVRNYRVVGQLTPVRAHTNVILDESQVDRDDALVTQLLNKKIGFGRFLGRYGVEFARFFTPTLGRLRGGSEFKTTYTELLSTAATVPVMIMAVIGACMSKWKMREVSLLLILIFSFALVYALFLSHVRYRIPVEPYIILLAAQGIAGTVQRLRARRSTETEGGQSLWRR